MHEARQLRNVFGMGEGRFLIFFLHFLFIWKQMWRLNSTNFPTLTSDVSLTKLIGMRAKCGSKLKSAGKIFQINNTFIS